MSSVILQAFGIVLSAAATIIGGLVLYNFKLLAKRIDSHDARIKDTEKELRALALRKETCQQEFVPMGQFLREAGHTRMQLDEALKAVHTMTAKIDILNQLPQIAGHIAKEILAQRKD